MVIEELRNDRRLAHPVSNDKHPVSEQVVKIPRTNCPVSEQIVKSHPVSNDKNPISDDKHPVSNDKHPGSNYKHPVSEQIVKIQPVSE